MEASYNTCITWNKVNFRFYFQFAELCPCYQDHWCHLVGKLQHFVSNASRLFVISGAGLSTESGIPDYRSDGVGLYARTDRRPMQYGEFVRSAESRQRYWARNYVGWPSVLQPPTKRCAQDPASVGGVGEVALARHAECGLSPLQGRPEETDWAAWLCTQVHMSVTLNVYYGATYYSSN